MKDDNLGQQQPKNLVNVQTGELKTVDNKTWREQGKELRAQGFKPVEEEAETTDTGGTGSTS